MDKWPSLLRVALCEGGLHFLDWYLENRCVWVCKYHWLRHLVEYELLKIVELAGPLVQGAVAGRALRRAVQLQHSLHLMRGIIIII